MKWFTLMASLVVVLALTTDATAGHHCRPWCPPVVCPAPVPTIIVCPPACLPPQVSVPAVLCYPCGPCHPPAAHGSLHPCHLQPCVPTHGCQYYPCR